VTSKSFVKARSGDFKQVILAFDEFTHFEVGCQEGTSWTMILEKAAGVIDSKKGYS